MRIKQFSTKTQEFITFDCYYAMSTMVNFHTEALIRSPRTSDLKKKSKKSSRYNFTTLLIFFCTLGVAASAIWSPDVSQFHSRSHNFLFATVSSYHIVDQLFDNTLKSIFPIAPLSKKEDNETYTLRQMIKQLHEG